MTDQHSPPIKSTKQLITLVVLAFVVPVLVIVLLVVYVTGAKRVGVGADAMTPERIADRLRPVGTVVLGAPVDAAAVLQSGEIVYKLSCSACHTAGVAGAPRTGDLAAWRPRLAQGFDVLVRHSIDGFKAMPPKGGNPNLDPIEVARAVAYIGNLSGGKFVEPEAAAAKK